MGDHVHDAAGNHIDVRAELLDGLDHGAGE